ncbi:MAG: hypothetical protein K0R78_2387 [Pelosinus sp.]|nr:hypothetical protein [Pelosinus sp.]
MDKLCPVCNGLQGITEQCPICGEILLDGGSLQNYVGPYSPYMESDIDNKCIHLLFCTECGYDVRATLKLVSI